MYQSPSFSLGWIQIERFVSVSSDRNIRDHLWRWYTYFGRNILTEIRCSIFDKHVLCPNKGIIQKKNLKWSTRAISIGWPSLIGKCPSIFLRHFHWSLTGQFGIMESIPRPELFQPDRESFAWSRVFKYVARPHLYLGLGAPFLEWGIFTHLFRLFIACLSPVYRLFIACLSVKILNLTWFSLFSDPVEKDLFTILGWNDFILWANWLWGETTPGEQNIKWNDLLPFQRSNNHSAKVLRKTREWWCRWLKATTPSEAFGSTGGNVSTLYKDLQAFWIGT